MLNENAPFPHCCFLPDGYYRTVKMNKSKGRRQVSYHHAEYEPKQMTSIQGRKLNLGKRYKAPHPYFFADFNVNTCYCREPSDDDDDDEGGSD